MVTPPSEGVEKLRCEGALHEQEGDGAWAVLAVQWPWGAYSDGVGLYCIGCVGRILAVVAWMPGSGDARVTRLAPTWEDQAVMDGVQP